MGMKNCNSQKSLEQGRVVCYAGLDRHIGIDMQSARHTWCWMDNVIEC